MHIRLVVTMVEFKSQECHEEMLCSCWLLETQNQLSTRQHHTSIMTTLTMLTEDDSACVFLLVLVWSPTGVCLLWLPSFLECKQFIAVSVQIFGFLLGLQIVKGTLHQIITALSFRLMQQNHRDCLFLISCIFLPRQNNITRDATCLPTAWWDVQVRYARRLYIKDWY